MIDTLENIYFYKEEISDLERDTLNELEYEQVLNKIAKYALSEMGREMVMKSLPTKNNFILTKELDLIEELINLLTSDEELPIERVSDIRNLLYRAKIENAILNPSDILSIGDSIRIYRLLRKYFIERSEKYTLLFEEVSLLYENRILEKHIDDAIDETGLVRDTASSELSRIRRSLQEKSTRLRSRLRKILHKVAEEEIISDDFYSIREGRYVLPIKASNKRTMAGIIHGVSQTGQTVFLEPAEIIEMNNEISLLKSEEEREIYRILAQLTAEIGQQAQLILGSVDILGHLDAVISKARYALEYGGIKPKITEENMLSMRNIRHPLLAQARKREQVIPLSITFSQEKLGHLISGPNAGGKTVALKSIGLNLIMALSGIFPLGECTVSYRKVFSSIGDRQSIANDLSTFSSQILQLKRILEECSYSSLVLVDEIGSGTDPQEGGALACGILDSFINIGLFFVATTHQSSLKTYALNREKIMNASLEFDEIKFRPTYKFLEGIPGNSYAFFLAKNVGLSELVISRARTYLGSRQSELEESISVLGKYKAEAEQLRSDAARAKLESEKLVEKLQEKLSKIQIKRDEIINDAKSKASELVLGANSLIEKTIRDIKEEKKSLSDVKKEYTQEKQKIEQAIKPEKKELLPEEKPFAIGDMVTMDSANSVGEIVALQDDGKTALVDFNGLKFNTAINKLTKSNKKSAPLLKKQDFVRFDVEHKIDVRGERADAAIRQLDEFISDAVVGNVERLTIVHGKGTGALRHAVQEYLTHHPSVASFRSGDLVEGGDGVTIVEL
jgi:DNA mismatch repair protein MutS2